MKAHQKDIATEFQSRYGEIMQKWAKEEEKGQK